MILFDIVFFYIPLVLGIYYFFKDIKKFSIFLLINYASGVSMLGIPDLFVRDIFHFFVIIYLIDYFLVKKKKLIFDKGGKLLSIFFLVFISHLIAGQNNDMLRTIFNKFFLFFDFLFFIAILEKHEDIKIMVDYSIIAVVVSSVFGIIVYLFQDVFQSTVYSYIIFSYRGGFRFGAFNQAYMLFIFSLVFLKGTSKLGLSVFSIALTIFSGNRTSFFMIVVAMLFYFLIQSKKYNSKIELTYMMPVVLAIIIFFSYIQNNPKSLPVYFGRYALMLSDPIKAGGGRIETYNLAWERIQTNFLFGNRIENRKVISKSRRNKFSNAQIHAFSGYMQNGYLANLYVYGIVGLGLMLYIIYYYYNKSKYLYLNLNRDHNKSFLFLNLIVVSSAVWGLSGGAYLSVLIEPHFLALISFGISTQYFLIENRVQTPPNNTVPHILNFN
ncbi:MAG: O-antigen ligase family protein [Deferribacteres bacterium]|nr:O-antigen ligase family protein [Deferribacteres bacterium]